MSVRNEKITELVRAAAASYIKEEANRLSLITVTRVVVTDDEKEATIFFTVYPTEKESDALDFLKRKRSEFKAYSKSHMKIRRIPFFDFRVDTGEKNRQRIDELSQ